MRISGTLEGLESPLASVATDSPVTAELRLEVVVEGIFVRALLRGRLVLVCARCLKPFGGLFEVEASEMFVSEPDPDGEEYAIEPTGELDLDQMARDAIGVELPFSPLHDPSCLGLCHRCGGDLNLGECTCTEPQIDPRWEGLSELLNELATRD